MEPLLVLRRYRTASHQNGFPNRLSYSVFPSASMQSTHHFSSKQDCNNIEEVPSFILRAALSAMPFLSRIDVALKYNDSMMSVFTGCAKFQRHVCQKNDMEEIMESAKKTTSLRDQPERSKNPRGDLRGSSEMSPPRDEITGDAEARNDFWSIQGDYIWVMADFGQTDFGLFLCFSVLAKFSEPKKTQTSKTERPTFRPEHPSPGRGSSHNSGPVRPPPFGHTYSGFHPQFLAVLVLVGAPKFGAPALFLLLSPQFSFSLSFLEVLSWIFGGEGV